MLYLWPPLVFVSTQTEDLVGNKAADRIARLEIFGDAHTERSQHIYNGGVEMEERPGPQAGAGPRY